MGEEENLRENGDDLPGDDGNTGDGGRVGVCAEWCVGGAGGFERLAYD
jgi:hypothetical protein